MCRQVTPLAESSLGFMFALGCDGVGVVVWGGVINPGVGVGVKVALSNVGVSVAVGVVNGNVVGETSVGVVDGFLVVFDGFLNLLADLSLRLLSKSDSGFGRKSKRPGDSSVDGVVKLTEGDLSNMASHLGSHTSGSRGLCPNTLRFPAVSAPASSNSAPNSTILTQSL